MKRIIVALSIVLLMVSIVEIYNLLEKRCHSGVVYNKWEKLVVDVLGHRGELVEELEKRDQLLNLLLKVQVVKLGEYEVTAYDLTGTVPFNDGLTSIGLKVGDGIIAVDPKEIAYGSLLWLHGEGVSLYGVAGDTGSAMRKGRVLDVFMFSNEEAKEFGRKKLQVEVIKIGR